MEPKNGQMHNSNNRSIIIRSIVILIEIPTMIEIEQSDFNLRAFDANLNSQLTIRAFMKLDCSTGQNWTKNRIFLEWALQSN